MNGNIFGKSPASINIFLGIITFIGVISLASPFWSLDLAGIDIMLGLSIFFYVLAIAAGSIAVTVCVAVRYYKNVYTDEGYLTNTLPVTARQIVISKTVRRNIMVYHHRRGCMHQRNVPYIHCHAFL